MVRLDYFGTLEDISQMVSAATRLACKECRVTKEEALSEIRENVDKKICLVERTLVADFIPPLQRKDIAVYAHSLSRVMERATDCYHEGKNALLFCPSNIKNEEACICVELCEQLARETKLLRALRRSGEMPDAEAFRNLLAQGREAHKKALSRINSGALPKSYVRFIITLGALRHELGECYDKLVEVMIDNV